MKSEKRNLSKNEMIMIMNDQEREIEKLTAQVEELRAKLEHYELKTKNAGTLAEASAQINELFEAAQATADTYLENIRLNEQRTQEILEQVESKADAIIREAENLAQKRLDAAEAEVDEKWAVIESRLLVMYESHKGLQELVESGIFNVPKSEK